MIVSKALDIWENKLKCPKKDGSYAIERLSDSNLLLVKDFENKVGFIIENTLQVKNYRTFKKFEISFFDKLFNPKSRRFHQKCLTVVFDKNTNPEFLIRILVGLMENSLLRKKISSKEFIDVIRKVSETFDLSISSTQEVVGVWGELYFLNKLIQLSQNDVLLQSRLIKSWESVLGRKKIDFRFINTQIAVEIKTTTKEERVHHIAGLDQVKPPLGFNDAYFLSIRIVEDDNLGESCYDLCKKIRNSLVRKELQLEFDERVLIRGSFACKNNDYRFTSRDKVIDSFYLFSKIPKPLLPKGVLSVEWNVDFDRVVSIGKSKSKNIFKRILNTTDL
jgi:hypothetical protein